jgi:transcriptional regulator with XRE-family HTH domain
MKHFNQFVQEKRMEREMSLRQFCKAAALDPSNWSKIERGLVKQGQSHEILDRISTVLNLNEADRQTLKDLAVIDSIPTELMLEDKIVESLPIFFRTVRGDKPSEDELNLLYQLIQKSSSEG